MKITINGLENNQPFDNDTLESLLQTILEKNTALGNFFSKIRVNNEEIGADSGKIQQIPVSEIETLDIEISSLGKILERNIDNAEDYLKKLIPGIQKASELFRTGSEQEANKFFLNIIDGMDWFSELVESITQAIDINVETRLFEGQSIQDRKVRFMELTQQMVEANKNKDWILLADLLEYEIQPLYSEWENILPQIQKERVQKFP